MQRSAVIPAAGTDDGVAAVRASPVVAGLLAAWGLSPDAPGLAVDRRDEMLSFLRQTYGGDDEQALAAYYRSGRDIAHLLAQVLRWRFGAPLEAEAVLDFASGFGRVTRFLAGEVAPARLWVSDILPAAVAFQTAAFGVAGVVSALHPADLRLTRDFDAITVTSLFTHLPEERFAAWLAALWQRLRPGGLLLFSTHDVALHPDGSRRGESFVFERVSESGSLSLDDYGTSWVAEPFVRQALQSACPEGSALRLARALCNFQDLWVVAREPFPGFSGLALQGTPEVMVDDCTATAGEVAMRGWAINRHGSVARVELTRDGERVAAAVVEEERPDVAAAFGPGHLRCGWRCRLPLPVELRNEAVLGIRAVDGEGDVHVCHVGRLDTLLAQLRAGQLLGIGAELHRVRTEHAAYRAASEEEVARLRWRIAAMEASRFWKLRNAWFSLKRAMRLTSEP
jgi:SAM-dependent methyltransferase